jgi:hypothetical protein
MIEQERRTAGEARARDYPHEAGAIAKLIEAEEGSEAREIAQAELWLARAIYHWTRAATADERERMGRVTIFCEQQLAALQGGPRPDVSDETMADFMRRVF